MSRNMVAQAKVSFKEFFFLWAKEKNWTVPWFHLVVCDWLEDWSQGRVKVLRVFRGAAKSTIVGIWDAFELYINSNNRLLVQSATDEDALKMTRDCRDVLKKHQLCEGMLPQRRAVAESRINLIDNEDARNANVTANGILSQITGSRANIVVFDDVEVPNTIGSPELRQKLRRKLGEATHILIPGGRKLYIGTPHTHDSLYDELEKSGADCLTLKLFSRHKRYEEANGLRFDATFDQTEDGYYVFSGNRLLAEGIDYIVQGRTIHLSKHPGGLLDIYTGNIWPDRFTRDEMQFRRAECKTINEWDSQYQLESKPIHEIRLDANKLIPYNVEPQIRSANDSVSMWLGKVQIVGARIYWDVASGKKEKCDSVLSLILSDDYGNLYWHRSITLLGDIFSENKEKKPYTQCYQAKKLMEEFQVSQIHVETNGIGEFVPALMREELKGMGCGVIEVKRSGNKHEYILEGIEPPLNSGLLWAHEDVYKSGATQQMMDFIPGVQGQKVDHIDACAGAITQSPIRINKPVAQENTFHGWQPGVGSFEIEFNTN